MKCPHCTIHFHDNWYRGDFMRDGAHLESLDGKNKVYIWTYRTAICPGPDCGKIIIQFGTNWANGISRSNWVQFFPRGANRGPVPPDVPPDVAQDYTEACNVLPISAKASAALSRR